MTGREHADRLWTNLRDLGARRVAALGFVGLAVLLLVGVGTWYLSRPERQVLYSGLEPQDVTRIGGVLGNAGIPFDVTPDGTTVLVAHGDAIPARMLLAERGLPQSETAGYELFDQLGSFGLTSFMQEVTRVRALEGELARTIQTMEGVTAARVHIVMSDRGSFRRAEQPASASVVIRTERADDAGAAQAIRQLVAAAIPGMKVDNVTVLNTDGSVLAAGEDARSAASGRLARLQNELDAQIEENVRRTLVPYLGLPNFTVSVASRLNTDRTTETATVFDPDGRVERSVRSIRETSESRNSTNEQPTTVQQNIPQEELPPEGGADSTERNERREELTNFEISARTVETRREGFTVERLTIAVLVNRDRLLENAGTGDGAVPVERQLADIEALVRAAAGFDQSRGDEITLAAVGFRDGVGDLAPVPPPGLGEIVMRQLGTLINAATILVVAVLLIWFGLRPAVRAILARSEDDGKALPEVVEAAPLVPDLVDGAPEAIAADVEPNLIEDLTSQMNRTAQKRLEQLVEYDEEQAAALLKQWLMMDQRV